VIYSDLLKSECPGFDSEHEAPSPSSKIGTARSFTGRNVLKKRNPIETVAAEK